MRNPVKGLLLALYGYRERELEDSVSRQDTRIEMRRRERERVLKSLQDEREVLRMGDE